MKSLRCRLLAFSFAAALAGCSLAPTINSGIDTAVVAFHPANASQPGDGGTITLRFVNDTVASLGFSRSEHKLYFNGTQVATLVNDAAFGIVNLSSITRDLPVRFDNPAYIRQLAAGDSAVVKYRLESRVYQLLGDQRNEMHMTAEGTLDLHGTPAAAAK